MRKSAAIVGVALACTHLACSGGDGGDAEARAEVVAFLKGRSYQAWTAEPASHASAGPHGLVRVFFDPVVEASLRAGAAAHPTGSTLVKELYDDDGTTLIGHAYERKEEVGGGGAAWTFFQGFTLDDYTGATFGRGAAACAGCHAGGNDFVMSMLP